MPESKTQEFKSPFAMLQWQWRSMIEELAELQRHASDPTCPCTLADFGEYCLQKHALGLHTLAKETIAMAPEHTEMLEQLAEEALDQHNALNERIVCNKPSDAEKDTVVWSRQWRKKIEQLYYRQACKVKAGMKQELSCTLEQTANLKGKTEIEIGVADINKTRMRILTAIVDTGATFVTIPLHIIRNLGLQFARKQKIQTSDARVIERDLYIGHINFMGKGGQFEILAGEIPLIGALFLESLGFKVNPITRQLENAVPGQYLAQMNQEPKVRISGQCTASSCSLKVKGVVETVIRHMEKRTGNKEEAQAIKAYTDRADQAFTAKDNELQRLYSHTAEDEAQHKSEFTEAAKARGCKYEALKVKFLQQHENFEIYHSQKPTSSFYDPKYPKGYRIFSKTGNRWAHYDKKGVLVKTGEGTSKPNPEELIIWNNKMKQVFNSWVSLLPDNIYIRYGKLPKSSTSENYSTGLKEKGVSVYAATKDLINNSVWPDVLHGALPAAAIVRGLEGADIYLVTGNRVATGSDNEPVIRNVSILGKLKLHPNENVAGFILSDDKADLHFDPLLTAIGCQINPATCFAQNGKTSELPVCSKDQKKDRASCINQIKETLPAGCNSKTWNKPGKPEGCVNPFKVCTVSINCRIGKKGE